MSSWKSPSTFAWMSKQATRVLRSINLFHSNFMSTKVVNPGHLRMLVKCWSSEVASADVVDI
jgi:hypothetical protein